ncbi:hypothetical protein MKZ38_010181 [Zalerion maritima]|uniref:Translation initiation factor IF-2, mitochondrial n=1 Tax=Zalerion maritima TaxID=339359 RepID=A0AAD5RFJ9_9PEZI|nr:hypothetical protein MKZ38_010181 [Zalerion maritima]
MIRNSIRRKPTGPSHSILWQQRATRYQCRILRGYGYSTRILLSSINLQRRVYSNQRPPNVPNIPGMGRSIADQRADLLKRDLLKQFGAKPTAAPPQQTQRQPQRQAQQPQQQQQQQQQQQWRPLQNQQAPAGSFRPSVQPGVQQQGWGQQGGAQSGGQSQRWGQQLGQQQQSWGQEPRTGQQGWSQVGRSQPEWQQQGSDQQGRTQRGWQHRNNQPAHGVLRKITLERNAPSLDDFIPRDRSAVRTFDGRGTGNAQTGRDLHQNGDFKSLDASRPPPPSDAPFEARNGFDRKQQPPSRQLDRDGYQDEHRVMETVLNDPDWFQLKRKPQQKEQKPPILAPPATRLPKSEEGGDVWDVVSRQPTTWKPQYDIPSDTLEDMETAVETKRATKSKGTDYWDDVTSDIKDNKAARKQEERQSRDISAMRQREKKPAQDLERSVEVDGMKIVFGDGSEPQTSRTEPKKRQEYINRDERMERRSKKKGKHSGPRRSRNNEDDEGGWDPEQAAERKRIKEERRRAKLAKSTPQINIPEYISVSNLASALQVKRSHLLEQLFEWGFDNITAESIMTGETAALVAQEHGYDPQVNVGTDEDLKARPVLEDRSSLPGRPPVVTIMGHVDHGKTTLLDNLRKSSIALQEHGGITQHIGAFSVKLSTGKVITFLDTPGHAAFLTMRQRGANVTDIVVLVVAADDSVMPQTLEALKHARSAKVPIIVAINKVDKPQADVQRVKNDLGRHGIELEEYGGEVQAVEISGKTGQGMADLEENIVLLAEVQDLRGDPTGMAEGWIIESTLKDVGKSATVLVKRGTLRVGDIIVAGKTLAKVRALRNEAGVDVAEAGPGVPVEVLGWRDSPQAGDEVIQAPSEQRGRIAIHYREDLETRGEESAEAVRQHHFKEERAKTRAAAAEAEEAAGAAGEVETVEQRRRRLREEEEAAASGTKLVNFVVRADVAGSVEAVVGSIQEIGNHEVQPRVLRTGVGPPSTGDVDYAATTGCTIVNFNNEMPGNVTSRATRLKVNMIDHSVIYHLQDAVKEVIEAQLPPRILQKVLGEADVLQVFSVNIIRRKYKNIAGSRVTNGTITMGKSVRVMRKGEKIFEGKMETLKQVKKDVKSMVKGQECGIGLADFDDVEPGDVIQLFEEVEEKRHL